MISKRVERGKALCNGRYALSQNDMEEFFDMYGDVRTPGAFEVMNAAYCLGLDAGRRYEKNRLRKKGRIVIMKNPQGHDYKGAIIRTVNSIQEKKDDRFLRIMYGVLWKHIESSAKEEKDV